MTRADQQRIRRIAKHYRWIDRQMEEVSVLTGDEIANLSIESGTLNERERAKINNHALATLGMLDLLPFPAELQRVPEIVAGTRNGRDRQPLLQARILAIADTLVSVTAENRSYRKTNSLAEAMEILFSMRDAGRLDAELLDLLVRERLHQQYAAEFLSEEQRGFGPS
jgi:HD-GYP domain-containing protein (c-di-GMP phosphodiesterase class II)